MCAPSGSLSFLLMRMVMPMQTLEATNQRWQAAKLLMLVCPHGASLPTWTSLWIFIWENFFLFFETLYLRTLLPWLNWYTYMYMNKIHICIKMSMNIYIDIDIYIIHRHFYYNPRGSMIPCNLDCGLIWEKERFLMTCPLEWAFVRSGHIRDVTNSNVQTLCTNSTSKHWLHLTECLCQSAWLLWQH